MPFPITQLKNDSANEVDSYEQTLLMDIMKQLGYSFNRNGICFGISIVSATAFLSGNLKACRNRLDNLNHIASRKERIVNVAKKKKLTSSDIDILAFFDTVLLLQSPTKLHELIYYTPLAQESLAAYDIVMPLDLKKKPYINTHAVINGCYDVKSLWSCLNSIENLVNESIALILGNDEHYQSLLFDHDTKTWFLVDANRLPYRTYKYDNRELAQDIIYGFGGSQYASFSTKALQINHQECNLFASIKNNNDFIYHQNRIYNEISQSALVQSWCLSAFTRSGHMEGVKRLLKGKKNVNELNMDNNNLARSAAEYGHAELLLLLIEYGVDLNEADNMGFTPAHVAALHGHSSVMKVLAKHGADLNKATTNGSTPAFVAALCGHTNVIEVLIEYDADISITLKTHAKFLYDQFILRNNLPLGAASRFKKFLEDNQGKYVNLKPLQIAKLLGHHEIARRIEVGTQTKCCIYTPNFFKTVFNPSLSQAKKYSVSTSTCPIM